LRPFLLAALLLFSSLPLLPQATASPCQTTNVTVEGFTLATYRSGPTFDCGNATLTVCTTPQYQPAVSPKVGHFTCAGTTTVVLP